MPLAFSAPRMKREGSTGIKQFDDRIAAAARSDADRRVAMKSVADRRRASVRAAGGNLGLSVAEREAQLVRSHRAIKSTVADGEALLEHSRAYAALKSRLGASAAATIVSVPAVATQTGPASSSVRTQTTSSPVQFSQQQPRALEERLQSTREAARAARAAPPPARRQRALRRARDRRARRHRRAARPPRRPRRRRRRRRRRRGAPSREDRAVEGEAAGCRGEPRGGAEPGAGGADYAVGDGATDRGGVRGPLGALEEDAHAADRRRRAVAGALLRARARATEAPVEFTTEQQRRSSGRQS